MTDDAELLAIYQSIITQPEEDLHRLAYADRLLERGEPGDAEQAEFIQVQIELVKLPELVELNRFSTQIEWNSMTPQLTQGSRFELTDPANRIGILYYRGTNPDVTRLRKRERILLDRICCQIKPKWWLDLLEIAPHINLMFSHDVHCTYKCVMERGFLQSVSCLSSSWLKMADHLTWHPDQRMTCSGCDGQGGWYTQYGDETADWVDCQRCDGGGVPRSFQPTAQPITHVTFTALDALSSARSDNIPLHVGWFAGRWPWIKFDYRPFEI